MLNCRKKVVMAVILALLLSFVAVPAYAASPTAGPNSTSTQAGLTLSLSQAITMAKTNSIKLRQAQINLENADALKDLAAQNLQYIPMGYGISPEAASAWQALLNADINTRSSEMQEKLLQDNLEVIVPQIYWTVQSALEAEKIAEKALQVAQTKAKQAQLSYQAGALSRSDATLAGKSFDQARADLEKARNTVNKAYLAFNQLVGLPADARPELVDTPSFEPAGVVDLDHEVARVLAESPTLTLAEQTINKAKYDENIVGSGASYVPYSVRHSKVVAAELSAADERDRLATLVRDLYAQIIINEENYRSTSYQLEQAQEKLRVLKVQESAGMVTKAAVQDAELAVDKMQQALDELTRQHAYLKLAFAKPWAASGGSSGSGS